MGLVKLAMADKPKSNLRERARDEVLIFVVDDDVAVGEVIEASLEINGYKSRVFADPEKACEAIINADPQPAVIITDYLMPRMNGMELIQACKKARPQLRFISASGTLHVDDTKDYAHKPDRFLAKPFFPSQLLDAVDELLEEAGQ